MTTLPSGLQFEDTTPGTGAEAKPGQRVKVHYTGWLYDPTAANARGKKFDSSKAVSYTHLDVYKRQYRARRGNSPCRRTSIHPAYFARIASCHPA